MSKSALKKELATFTREQLVDVVLNAYSSSPEAKAYFEFFLNPDPNALLEKKLEEAKKELKRTKYGYSKARISVLKKLIKDVENYGAGDTLVYALTLNLFAMLYVDSHYYYFSDSLINGMCKFAADAFVRGNMSGHAQETVDKIMTIMSRCTSPYSERIRSAIADAANDARVLISFQRR